MKEKVMKPHDEINTNSEECQRKSIKLYYTDIQTELSPSEYEKCVQLITPEKAKRLNRFHFVEDRKRTLYGEVLARCFFMKGQSFDKNYMIAVTYCGKKRNIEIIYADIKELLDSL